MNPSARVIAIAAAAVPVLTAALWIYGGRESLSKREKNVEIEVIDETFGDKITRVESQRGPVFGYYIGLDAVAAAGAAGIGIGCVAWRLRRRQARQTTGTEK